MPTANIQNTFKLLLLFCTLVASFVIIREFRAKKTVRMTDGEGNAFTGEINTHYFGGRKRLSTKKRTKPETTEAAA